MRVLLVRFSAIGDCAMAAWTATCVRRSYPEAHLTWVVERRCAAVVDESKLVTRRAIYERDRWKRGAWSLASWREQMAFYGSLRREKFDLGLDLQGHSKTAICLRLSGAKRRLSVRATDSFAQRLNPVVKDFGGLRHTVERQLFALRSLGNFKEEPSPPMMPAHARPTSLPNEPYVLIAVGAGQPWKAYPYWGQVASLLKRKVVFVGGPEEKAPPVEGAIDLVGKLSLEETMGAIAEASLVLAADTGAGHLAAAYGVPVVSVFGPTDPGEFRPYTERGVVLKEGEETGAVKPEQVVEAGLRLLEGK